jgi:hypothetical protein
VDDAVRLFDVCNRHSCSSPHLVSKGDLANAILGLEQTAADGLDVMLATVVLDKLCNVLAISSAATTWQVSTFVS